MKEKKIHKYTRYGWFVRFCGSILRLWTPRPKIVVKGEIPERSLLVANHSGAAGPIYLTLFFPDIIVPWSSHEMSENYCERWKYLYHIFYRRKKKYGKISSFLLATLLGLVIKFLYNGMRVIPTYPDIRLRKTFKLSRQQIDQGNHVLVFPEDSNDGYHDVAEKYYAGFAAFALSYYRHTGFDLPMTPIYFSKENRIIVIGETERIKTFVDRHATREEIADHFLKRTHELRHSVFQEAEHKF